MTDKLGIIEIECMFCCGDKLKGMRENIMNNNSGYDESCMDDGAWDSLFKMAENAEYESDFEGQAASGYDMPVYDNVAFQENVTGGK